MRIPNPQVAGSIPAGGTKQIKRLAIDIRCQIFPGVHIGVYEPVCSF